MPVYGWGKEVAIRPLLASEIPWPEIKGDTPIQLILMGYPNACLRMLNHLNIGPFRRRRVMQIHPRPNPQNALAALRGVLNPEVILVEGCQDLDPEVWEAMYQTEPIRIQGDPSYGTTLPNNWVRFRVDIKPAVFAEKPAPLQWP